MTGDSQGKRKRKKETGVPGEKEETTKEWLRLTKEEQTKKQQQLHKLDFLSTLQIQ
jgi:hypothetical protein